MRAVTLLVNIYRDHAIRGRSKAASGPEIFIKDASVHGSVPVSALSIAVSQQTIECNMGNLSCVRRKASRSKTPDA